jgi:hypothetical protein
VQVLLLAHEMGVLYGRARRDEVPCQCQPALRTVLRPCGQAGGAAEAEVVDQADVPDGMSIPELARREARLSRLAEARTSAVRRSVISTYR